MIASLIVASALFADPVAWEKDFDSAFAKAKERNVPVLVCFNMDGESASDDTVKIYKDPEFAAASRDFVCVIASTFMHSPAGTPTPCPRFGGITCDEHHKLEIKTSDAFVGKDVVISPQHVLVTPDKVVLTRRAYFVSKDELLKMMKRAEKALRTGAAVGADAEALATAATKIEDLLKGAKDRNAERRKPAIRELGTLDDLRARDALFALLGPKVMDDTRADALDALATKGNYDALPYVIERLGDSNMDVQRHAIVALEKIGLPGGVEPLMKLWKKKPAGRVACEIPRALACCAPTDADVQALVKKACGSKDSATELSAVVALKSLAPDAETRKILSDKLSDRNGNVRGVATWTIGMMRDRELKAALEAQLAAETNVNVKPCIDAALKNLALEDGAKPLPELSGMLWQFYMSDLPHGGSEDE